MCSNPGNRPSRPGATPEAAKEDPEYNQSILRTAVQSLSWYFFSFLRTSKVGSVSTVELRKSAMCRLLLSNFETRRCVDCRTSKLGNVSTVEIRNSATCRLLLSKFETRRCVDCRIQLLYLVYIRITASLVSYSYPYLYNRVFLGILFPWFCAGYGIIP